jgi:hypothetical protein
MALTTFARFAIARTSSRSNIRIAWPTRSYTRRSPRGAMTRIGVVAGLATALYLLHGSSAIAAERTPSACTAYGWKVLLPSYSGYKYSNSLQQTEIRQVLKVNGLEMLRKLAPVVKSAVRSRGFRVGTAIGIAAGGTLAFFGEWLEDRHYCFRIAGPPAKMEE